MSRGSRLPALATARRRGRRASTLVGAVAVATKRRRRRRRAFALVGVLAVLAGVVGVEIVTDAERQEELGRVVPDAVLPAPGPLRAELEQLAESLKLRNARFVGWVSNSQMPQWLDQADIYLTTTDIDNMPVSILECYASGLPVVATKAGGIPYIAVDGETAMLAELGDHEGVAKAALQLLADPVLVEKITSTAYEQCRTRYAGEEIARQWAELYKELVATGAGTALAS